MEVSEAIRRYRDVTRDLEVVGTERGGSQGRISLLVKCPICSNDEYVKEGLCSGVFKVTPSNLKRGSIPCRCSSRFNWTPDQSEYRVKRDLDARGFSFVRWLDNDKSPMYRGVVANCPRHGYFETTLCRVVNQGQFCPSCAGHSQIYGYLNLILDGTSPIAAKFGITSDPHVRLRGQNRKNKLPMVQIGKWLFEDVASCKEAEQRCKALLCGSFLEKWQLEDGYTESVSLSDVGRVIEIMSETGKLLK